MSERTAALKIALSMFLLTGIACFPLSGKAQEKSSPAPQSTQSMAKPTAPSAPSVARKGDQASKPRKEPTEAQLAARERRVKCGAEWREAKAKGALEEGATWPKYWSACNKRLKQQGV